MIDAVCSVTWPVPCCIGNFLFFFGKSDIWNMCWWKIIFSPQKWNDILFIPLHSPFWNAEAGNHFIHTYCCMLSRVWSFPEMFVDVYVSKYLYFWYIYIYVQSMASFFQRFNIHDSSKNRDSKKQTQKAWLSDIAIFFMFKFTAPASEFWHYLQKYCGPQHFWTLGTS